MKFEKIAENELRITNVRTGKKIILTNITWDI
jgi:hypothetical protein